MSSLKDKMYNYEMTPPANVWEKIKYSLDKDEYANEFSVKLQNLEVTPPAEIWEKINSTLDAEKNIPVRKIHRLSPLLRYAAAAVVIIGLTIFGIIKFSSKTSGEKEVAKKTNNTQPNDSFIAPKIVQRTPDGETNISDIATTITDQQRDDAALEESKKTYAKLDMSENNKRELRQALMMTPVDPISSDNTEYSSLEVCFPDNVRAILANSPAINTAERYIMLMTPDGNIIRVSKKWADLVCCVSGEDEDEGCQDQLKKWRQKIVNSAVAPSPANFMDILSMVELLKDNNP